MKNKGFYKMPGYQKFVLIIYLALLILLHGPWAYELLTGGIARQIYIHYFEYFAVPIIGFITGIITLKKTKLM